MTAQPPPFRLAAIRMICDTCQCAHGPDTPCPPNRETKHLEPLPLRFCPGVDIESDSYRKGHADGHVAPRSATEPVGRLRAYLAGWLDGHSGCQVPLWRLAAWRAERDRLCAQLIEGGHGAAGLRSKTNKQLRAMVRRLRRAA